MFVAPFDFGSAHISDTRRNRKQNWKKKLFKHPWTSLETKLTKAILLYLPSTPKTPPKKHIQSK